MKRFLIPAVMFALFAPIGLIGCAEKTEATKETSVSTPTGSETVTTTVEQEKTGDAKTNP